MLSVGDLLRRALWLLITLHGIFSFPSTKNEYTIRMPGVRLTQDDEYWCYAQKLDNETLYITKFEPIYDPELAHHMILFGCNETGSSKGLWQCGEMSDENTPVCKGTESIIFAWAMGAPTFKMPPDISHKVGQGTPTKYLVLQIHYKDSAAFQLDENKQDKSGIKLTTQRTPTEKLAGVYVLVSDGEVLPKQTTKLEMSCMYSGEATIHPFAFRVHAHEHGVLNDGYVIANNEKYLIGSKSPQLPQTFYPVENKSLEINPGDTITARCKMINNENKPIKIGNTRYDEMCNFYIMYWVKSEDENQLYDPNNQLCFLEDDDIIEKELNFEKLLPSEPFLSDIHNNFGLGAYTPFDIGDDENVYFPDTV